MTPGALLLVLLAASFLAPFLFLGGLVSLWLVAGIFQRLDEKRRRRG